VVLDNQDEEDIWVTN